MKTLSPGQNAWQPPSLAEMQALLPEYQFVSLIGHGGMGAVYKAVQISLSRLVAVKVLPAQLIHDADAHNAARFRQEALTLARLAHPGIVSVYESGEAGGLPFIVMEFVDGSDVARMIKSEGRLEPDRAIEILCQVCEALQYAHQRGVIHRDIKPANLLITREGQVKIADFGLAKRHDDTLLGLTKSNLTVGTPDFLAPEAWSLAAPLDHRADLYSMGVTLYQMLTGEVPRGLWKMPSVKVGADPRFDAIIDRAMQPERDARYQSTSELRRELERIRTAPAPPKRGKPSGTWVLSAGVAAIVVIVTAIMLLGLRAPRRPVLSFNGSQFVVVTNFAPIAPTNEVTVEFWAYTTRTPGYCVFDFTQKSNTNKLSASIPFKDQSIFWDFGSLMPSGRFLARQPDGTISNWFHYAFVATKKGDYMCVYGNGALLGYKTHCDSLTRSEGELYIGGDSHGGFSGQLAEFRIWNSARSQAQIKAGMTTRLTGHEDGLILYFPFDEGNGQAAANRAAATGAAYDGRLVDNPVWIGAQAPRAAPPIPAKPPRHLVVSTIEDYGQGSLRQMLVDAAVGDVITFAPSLSGGAILINSDQLVVSKDVTIDASALHGGIRIDGRHSHRIIDVPRRVSVILKGLILTNGLADRGGAIRNLGYVQMMDCAVCNCEATAKGGAVYTLESPLTMIGCTVAGNKAESGGGLWAGLAASLSVANCAIVDNRAQGGGGGLYLEQSQADIAASAFTGNAALTGAGGGIALEESLLTICNTTLTNNHATSDPDLKNSRSQVLPIPSVLRQLR